MADLSITKTDGSATYTPGSRGDLHGGGEQCRPSDAVGATVVDNAPAGTTITGWSAVFAGGATGNAGGSGDINEPVTIPGGGSITYTVSVVYRAARRET